MALIRLMSGLLCLFEKGNLIFHSTLFYFSCNIIPLQR